MSAREGSTQGTLQDAYMRQQITEKVALLESTLHPLHRKLLLNEAIDEGELDALLSKLDSMEKVAGSLGLDELNNGVQKAKERARNLVAGGLKGGILALTSKIAPDIAGIASFESGVINLFKQLPKLLRLVGETAEEDQIGVPGARAGEADPTSAARGGMQNLDNRQRKQLKGMILKAMKPPGVLGFFRGLPWINDELLANEILVSDATPEQFADVAAALGDVPIDDADTKEIAQAAKSAEKAPAGKQAKRIGGKSAAQDAAAADLTGQAKDIAKKGRGSRTPKAGTTAAGGMVPIQSMSAEQFASTWAKTPDANKEHALNVIRKAVNARVDAKVLYDLARALNVSLPSG